MEPESETPRSLIAKPRGLPAIGRSFEYYLLSIIGFVLMVMGIAGLFGKDSNFGVETLVSGALLQGLAQILKCQERLVQLREWELARRLQAETQGE